VRRADGIFGGVVPSLGGGAAWDCGREAAALTAGPEKAHGQKIADRGYTPCLGALGKFNVWGRA